MFIVIESLISASKFHKYVVSDPCFSESHLKSWKPWGESVVVSFSQAYSLSHLRCHPWAKSSLWSPSIHLDQNTLNSKNCWIRFWECLIHWDGLILKPCHPCAMFDSIFLGEACISASVFWSKIFMVHQYIHKQHNYITGVLQNEMIHMQF